jgi:hypothetical protein
MIGWDMGLRGNKKVGLDPPPRTLLFKEPPPWGRRLPHLSEF